MDKIYYKIVTVSGGPPLTACFFCIFRPATLPTLNAAAPAFGSTFSSTLQPPASTGGLTFGAKPATTAPSIGLTFGSAATKPPSSYCFTTTTTTTNAPIITKVGLGGIDVNTAQPKAAEGRTDSSKVKEMQLPQEITATVDTLKAHFKQQKTLSSDIVRASTTKLYNIQKELDKLNWSLTEVHNHVEANYSTIKQLRAETTKAIQEAEIAQITHDTLSGLQFENTAPLYYFMDLVRKFENQMQNLSKQVELTEKHMHSLTNPQTFTADDLKKGLLQIHECFIALAGRLQETHRVVETQNEQFVNLMKHREKGTTVVNVYDGAGSEFDSHPVMQRFHGSSRAIIPNASCGPTPFSSFVGGNQFGKQLKTNSAKPGNALGSGGNAFGSNPGSAWGDVGGTSSNRSGFGLTGGGGLFGSTSTTDDAYNLQKPPIGTKRNKH